MLFGEKMRLYAPTKEEVAVLLTAPSHFSGCLRTHRAAARRRRSVTFSMNGRTVGPGFHDAAARYWISSIARITASPTGLVEKRMRLGRVP